MGVPPTFHIPIGFKSSVVPRCWERAKRLTGWLPRVALSLHKEWQVASYRSIFYLIVSILERLLETFFCPMSVRIHFFSEDPWFREKSWYGMIISLQLSSEEKWHNGKGANRVKTKQIGKGLKTHLEMYSVLIPTHPSRWNMRKSN